MVLAGERREEERSSREGPQGAMQLEQLEGLVAKGEHAGVLVS